MVRVVKTLILWLEKVISRRDDFRESQVSFKTFKIVWMNEDLGVFWSRGYKKRDYLESSLFSHRALFGGTYGTSVLQNMTLSSLIPSL